MTTLKEAVEFLFNIQDKIETRAAQLYEAQEYTSPWPLGVSFLEDSITVILTLDSHPGDLEYIGLSLEQIEMTEDKWKEHLSQVREEWKIKRSRLLEEQSRLAIQRDREEYERLRKQFEEK